MHPLAKPLGVLNMNLNSRLGWLTLIGNNSLKKTYYSRLVLNIVTPTAFGHHTKKENLINKRTSNIFNLGIHTKKM